MNIARSRVHAKQRAAAAHLSVDRLVCVSDAPLHGHFDRRSNVNRSGTGLNIGIESSVRWQAQAHIAGPGARVPRSALLAFGRDFATSGLSMEAALDTTGGDVP